MMRHVRANRSMPMSVRWGRSRLVITVIIAAGPGIMIPIIPRAVIISLRGVMARALSGLRVGVAGFMVVIVVVGLVISVISVSGTIVAGFGGTLVIVVAGLCVIAGTGSLAGTITLVFVRLFGAVGLLGHVGITSTVCRGECKHSAKQDSSYRCEYSIHTAFIFKCPL